MASRGAWDRQGRWSPVPYVDTQAAERLFRFKVFTFLKHEELLSQERIDLLLSWHNSGFSVNNSVTATPDDPEAFERLSRYLLHPPLSLERMSFTEGQDKVHYRGKPNRGATESTKQPGPSRFSGQAPHACAGAQNPYHEIFRLLFQRLEGTATKGLTRATNHR